MNVAEAHSSFKPRANKADSLGAAHDKLLQCEREKGLHCPPALKGGLPEPHSLALRWEKLSDLITSLCQHWCQ